MLFFEIATSYWTWVLLLLFIYVALFAPTVKRFYREVISIISVEHRVRCLRLSFPMRAFTYLVLFIVAPWVMYRLKKLDEETQERKWRAEAERRRLAEERTRKENATRTDLRNDWLTQNRLKLFYNTVCGITAVFTPADYEECERLTARARRDGKWKKENVLLPSSKAFLFVDGAGRKLFMEKQGGMDPIENHRVSGWLTDLDDLALGYRIKLVQKEKIFVPFVNESTLSFEDHPLNQSPEDYEYGLVVTQVPDELQPIR